MPSETKKDAPTPASKTAPPAPPGAPRPARAPAELLDDSIASLERAVAQQDDRLLRSFLRQAVVFRRRLETPDLARAIRKYLPTHTPNRAFLLAALASLPVVPVVGVVKKKEDDVAAEAVSAMDIDVSDKAASASASARTTVLPELEIFFHLLVLSRCIGAARGREAKEGGGMLLSCVESATMLLARLGSFSRHTLDLIGSKVYILFSLVHELTGREAFASIRPALFRAYRTACLRRDDMGRATLVNLLLRNFIAFDMYEQAGKLLDSIPEQFPSAVSNNQFVRHLYYVGRVHAVNCEYGEAHQRLNVALRKAPQRTARGFRIAAQQLDCLVQLLIGEVPERSIFNAVDTRAALVPYLELTQAVRLGDLSAFTAAVEKHTSRFQSDGNFSLVQRLRHAVIKTGLRNISLSYSRISFADIAAKLRIDTAQDAEYMCAKAIRDGVIEATLDHDNGFLASSTSGNVYSTTLPQEQFHQRIEFCLSVHNDAVRSMQYPPKGYKDKSVAEREKKAKEADKEDESLEAEAADGGLDEDDAMEED